MYVLETNFMAVSQLHSHGSSLKSSSSANRWISRFNTYCHCRKSTLNEFQTPSSANPRCCFHHVTVRPMLAGWSGMSLIWRYALSVNGQVVRGDQAGLNSAECDVRNEVELRFSENTFSNTTCAEKPPQSTYTVVLFRLPYRAYCTGKTG